MLIQTRNLKMARSAHAYVRGSTVKFYAWLEEAVGRLPEGQPVWICGDCHLGNLGPLADAQGRVAVQIRDLDQTVIGNPAHDLVRLGLSLASTARGSNLSGTTTARIIEALVGGYEAALGDDYGLRIDKGKRPEDVQALLDRSVRRRWRHLAEDRLEGRKPTIPLGRKFWAISKDEQAGLKALVASEDVRAMATGLESRDVGDPIAMVDAAYWMKGCSSLGRMRFALLLRIGEGDEADFCLMDVKEAVTAAAPRSSVVSTPRDNAVRVVTGARALSPNLGKRMAAARLLGSGVVLRELMPQDLKIEVDHLSAEEAVDLARYLAGVVGRSHGRQMDAETREVWRADLLKAHSPTLEAPSWLWSSIVELLGIHEGAYLDHCRRLALGAAA